MRIRKLTVLALLLSLFLTSCTTSADTKVSAEDVSEAEYEWVAETFALDYAISSESINTYGNCIYFSTIDPKYNRINYSTLESSTNPVDGEIYSEYYCWNIEQPEPKKLNISGHSGVSYGQSIIMQPDENGNVYIFIGCSFIGKYDSSGNELFYQRIKTEQVNLSFHDLCSTAISDGIIYVTYRYAGYESGNNVLLAFDSDGNIVNECNVDYTTILSNSENNLYGLSNSTPAELVEINADGTTGKAFLSDYKHKNQSDSTRNAAIYGSDKVLARSETSMYIYNTSDGSVTELFRWSDIGIEQSRVKDFRTLSNGTIAVFLGFDAKNTYCTGIALVSQKEVSEKTTLTLGVMWADSSLLLSVARFNASHDDLKIQVKDYYDPFTMEISFADAITKFHLDIASGNCPDIICLDYDYLKNYAAKGMFTELTPYLEASGLNIPENILSSYTFNQGLVAIPPLVNIRTIVIPSAAVNGKSSWTLEEMIGFIEENDNSMAGLPILNVREDFILKYCLRANMSQFIDWENYTCSFEKDDFFSLLEFCHKYGTDTRYSNASVLSNIYYNDAVAYEALIISPTDDLLIRQFLEAEDITYIGFPTDNNGNLLEEAYGSLSIFSGSEYKDRAWEFIEYILSEVPAYEPYSAVNGFPVCSEVLSQYADAVTENPKDGQADRFEYSWKLALPRDGHPTALEHPPSDEEFAPIEELLRTAIMPADYDSTILDIILENAADYFSGEKSVEETAKQIQSRVMLYLGEIK